MNKICLDFEIALDFLRGDVRTKEKLQQYADREEICITSLTMMHLLETVSKKDVVLDFASFVTVLPLDKLAAQNASRISNDLRERGERFGINESVLTAAICMTNDALLYAKRPENFTGIKGLRKV
ncbi:MAG: type II toxin-antitoxin system VapC family toxin [Candidatus Micrarchaeota archaeon]